MNNYAVLNGTEILGVLSSEAAPQGGVLLSAPLVWSTRPSEHHRAHLINGVLSWQDNRSLAEAREQKLQELKVAREVAVNSTFTWDGSVFDSDQVSQTRLMGMYVDSQTPGFSTQAWRLADNSWRVLDAEDAAGVWAALKSHMAAQFTKFAALETQLNDVGTDTLAEVDAITW